MGTCTVCNADVADEKMGGHMSGHNEGGDSANEGSQESSGGGEGGSEGGSEGGGEGSGEGGSVTCPTCGAEVPKDKTEDHKKMHADGGNE